MRFFVGCLVVHVTGIGWFSQKLTLGTCPFNWGETHCGETRERGRDFSKSSKDNAKEQGPTTEP